jgi:hypothetical protein
MGNVILRGEAGRSGASVRSRAIRSRKRLGS